MLKRHFVFFLIVLIISLAYPLIGQARTDSDLLGVSINQTLEYSTEPVRLTATALYLDGTTKDVTNSGTWTTSHSSVARIDSNRGIVNFEGRQGAVEITFSYGNEEDTVSTTVKKFLNLEISPEELEYSERPQKLTVSGELDDGSGRISTNIDAKDIRWGVSNERVLDVDSNGRVIFSGKTGRCTITAIPNGPFIMDTDEFPSVEILVDEDDIEDEEVEETRAFKLIIEGDIDSEKKNNKLEAYKQYTDDIEDTEKLKSEDVYWHSYNEDIATVDDKGVVTLTGKPGKTYITANYKRWKSEKKEVYVPVKFVELYINESLNFTPLYLKNPPRLTASIKDTKNNIQLAPDITWSSSNEGIALIEPSGKILFTGEPGNVTFTASKDDLSTSISCTVPQEDAVAVEKVYITENLFYGSSPQVLKAFALFSDGSLENVTSKGNWTSSNPDIASVEQGYVYFSGNPGSLTISFNYEGFADSVSTLIYPSNRNKTLSGIKFLANQLTQLDADQEIIVYGIYSDNSTKPLNNIKLHSYQPNIASIDKNILKLSGTPGKATIEATGYGYRTTIDINVLQAEVKDFPAYLRIEGSLDTVGKYKQLKAFAVFTNGKQIDVTEEAIWNTTNRNIAFIKNNGSVEMLDNGPVRISAAYQNLQGYLSNKNYAFMGRVNPLRVDKINLTTIKENIKHKLTPNRYIPYPTDIDNHWAQKDILLARKLGWIGGYPDGSMRPDGTMNRGEYASLLQRALLLNTPYRSILYSDTNKHWAKESIAIIANLGLVPMNGSHKFRPNDPLTRGELAQMLANLFDVRVDTNYPFIDVPPSSNLVQAVAKLSQAGIMSGLDDLHFKPDEPATRAQALSVLLRLLKTDPELQGILNRAQT